MDGEVTSVQPPRSYSMMLWKAAVMRIDSRMLGQSISAYFWMECDTGSQRCALEKQGIGMVGKSIEKDRSGGLIYFTLQRMSDYEMLFLFRCHIAMSLALRFSVDGSMSSLLNSWMLLVRILFRSHSRRSTAYTSRHIRDEKHR